MRTVSTYKIAGYKTATKFVRNLCTARNTWIIWTKSASRVHFITLNQSSRLEWAVENGVTTGTSATTFSPDATCTTGQIITFLWRANGSPSVSGVTPFDDVSSSDYYYQAALWAKEEGLVSGSAFQGNTPCTRAATVTYLWKLADQPSVGTSNFTDVPNNADYAQAVAWAVQEGITSGTGNNAFSPNAICTRGQIVTFIYRDMVG